MHVENKGKHNLILGEVSTQGFDDTKLTTEAKYPIYLIQWGKKFALSPYYNGNKVSYLLILQKYINSISGIKDNPLRLVWYFKRFYN